MFQAGRFKAENYRPFKFIDRMEGNNHIILLHDNQKYTDMIIARYLSNGLQREESCIFFTSVDPQWIEARPYAQGINVALYKKANSLRIYSIERSDENKRDVWSTLKAIRAQATVGMKPPFRFVDRTITDTASKEGMQLGLQMCYYDISESAIEEGRVDQRAFEKSPLRLFCVGS